MVILSPGPTNNNPPWPRIDKFAPRIAYSGTRNRLPSSGETPGAEVFQTDYDDPVALRRACTDVDCVVSAINGLGSVIVGAQGLVSPGEFIPLAEDSNLIAEVGAFVLNAACTSGASWHAEGHDIEIAVNVSAFQLVGTGFPDVVRETLNRTRFPADALTLEVTESQAMSESPVNDDNLRELRSIGVGISIDDFGTGFSSLAQLHRLPVTEVKIDRSFTTRLGEDGSAAFVAGIVGLGHGLGLRVVAEGVETTDQMNALQAMGCERAQGFLFSRPVDAAAFEEQLRASKHA